MSVRRIAVLTALVSITALLFFAIGQYSAGRVLARQQAESDARIDALRAELRRSVAALERHPNPVGVSGVLGDDAASVTGRELLVTEVKRQLQDEMGLLPVQLLRERRQSFVELYAYDNLGKTNYGTAGYLGRGYFITVKHAVIPLPDDGEAAQSGRRIDAIRLTWGDKRVPATIVDAGDAQVEVHSGDWAILKVDEPVDLPALRINPQFGYEFAEPIFRLGNDYSKGIILSTGYVGQRTSNGLVTCLTDGHPGVSGGGVLDRAGDLVGIPIGRMQGDYRFSFILPLREEMFRKVPPAPPEIVPAPTPDLVPAVVPADAVVATTN